MAILRFGPAGLLLAACLMSCGGPRTFAPHVVGLDYLTERNAYLEGETQAGYRILVERWEVQSLEPQPQLREREYVLVPREKATRDPLLAVGDQIWVEGTHLRPYPVLTNPFATPPLDPLTIPPIKFTAP